MTEGARIYDAGLGWIGTPVVWEQSLRPAEGCRGGCDCRGLVAGAARDAGRPEAREIEARITGYAGRIDEAALLAGLDRLFDRVDPADAPQRGDVIALRLGRKVQHLALHDGGPRDAARMLHAYMGDPALVCEVPIDRFWNGRIHSLWRWRSLRPAASLHEDVSVRPTASLHEDRSCQSQS